MARPFTPEAQNIVHITVRCNNRDFFLNPAQHGAMIFTWLNVLPYFFDVHLHHVMLLSNHLHLMLTPQKNNLGAAMSYFLTNVAKSLNHSLERSNHIFGNRYHPTIIGETKHLINVIRYLYQNPVRAGMSGSAREYPYSSLGCYVGDHSGLRVQSDPYTEQLFALGTAGMQLWYDAIVDPLGADDVAHVGASLTRKHFKFTLAQTKALQGGHSRLHL